MNLLNWILIVVILVLLYLNAKKGKLEDIKFKILPPKKPVKEGHLAPIYYGYSGGYTKLNKCTNDDYCGIIGLYEDIHQVNPCPNCGENVRNFKPGYWGEKDGEKQWITKSDNEEL